MATKSSKAAASEPQKIAVAQLSQSAQRIDFKQAKIVGGIVSGTYFLVVSGTKPCLNMEVHLSPLIYIQQPEYWGIEVIGTLSGGICLPATAPYHVHIALAGITGTKGVEVIGASSSKKLNVPPQGGSKKAK